MSKKTLTSIVLLILGFIALGLGISYLIYSSNEENYDFSELTSDIPEDRILIYDSPWYKLDKENNQTLVHWEERDLESDTYLQFKILFKTKDVFSVANKIDYQIHAKVVGQPYIEKIIFFIESTALDYSAINEENFDAIIDRYQGESVIELVPKEPGKFKEEDITIDDDGVYHIPFGLTYFEDQSHFTVPLPKEISFIPYAIGTENKIYPLDKAENLFSVSPAYTKLQAETNRIITEYAQIQARNGDISLGLTLIVIGGIPLVIATQILIYRKTHNST